MPRSRLVVGLASMFGGQVATRLLGLVVTALVLRSVPIETVGEFGAATAWLGYGVMLVQLGHMQALIQLSQNHTESDISRIIAWRLTVAILLGLVAVVAIAAFAPFPRLGSTVALLSSVLIFNALAFDWQLAADHHFLTLSRIQIASQIVAVIAAAVCYVTSWPGALVLMQVSISGTLCVGIAIATGPKRFASVVQKALSSDVFRPRSLLTIVTRNWPFTLIAFVQALAVNLDLVLAGMFLAPKELGELAVIGRVGLALFGVQAVLNLVLFSHLLRGSVAGRVTVGIGLLSGVAVSALVLAVPNIILTIVAGKDYSYLSFELRLACLGLIAGSLFNAVITLAQHAAAVAGRIEPNRIIALAGAAVLLIPAAFVAIPHGVAGFIIFSAVKFSLLALALMGSGRQSSTIALAEVTPMRPQNLE